MKPLGPAQTIGSFATRQGPAATAARPLGLARIFSSTHLTRQRRQTKFESRLATGWQGPKFSPTRSGFLISRAARAPSYLCSRRCFYDVSIATYRKRAARPPCSMITCGGILRRATEAIDTAAPAFSRMRRVRPRNAAWRGMSKASSVDAVSAGESSLFTVPVCELGCLIDIGVQWRATYYWLALLLRYNNRSRGTLKLRTWLFFGCA